MKIHELKIESEYYKKICCKNIKAEIWKNDREFKQGDILFLREIEKGEETGKYIWAEITDILTHKEIAGLVENYVMLSFKIVKTY